MIIIEKQELENKIFSEKLSYEKIGKIYGCTGGYIRKYAKKLGISLPNRRIISDKETFNRGKNSHNCPICGKNIPSSQKYCSASCQQKHYNDLYVERWKNGEEDGIIGEYGISKHIRTYLFNKNNCKCEICGWGEKNKYTNKIPLEIHHKDGNYKNNSEENLQLLCPNCHSLTETFKSHNKTGRKKRKKMDK